ncbi:MAG TPA: hypothetical protein PKD24_14290 [Pyrinomonadaceae bacterium]|nr:hypothetical protein [Pyrinomonadaceae bacterium]
MKITNFVEKLLESAFLTAERNIPTVRTTAAAKRTDVKSEIEAITEPVHRSQFDHL